MYVTVCVLALFYISSHWIRTVGNYYSKFQVTIHCFDFDCILLEITHIIGYMLVQTYDTNGQWNSLKRIVHFRRIILIEPWFHSLSLSHYRFLNYRTFEVNVKSPIFVSLHSVRMHYRTYTWCFCLWMYTIDRYRKQYTFDRLCTESLAFRVQMY